MPSASVGTKTVVIADDTAFVRDRFRTAVEHAGHKAIVVTSAAALTLNLSHGGIAIRTTSPLDSGAKIKVRFRMPGSKKDIDGEGRIAWSDRRVGMGIQFEKVDAANQGIIDNFVDAHFFSNRKA